MEGKNVKNRGSSLNVRREEVLFLEYGAKEGGKEVRRESKE